MVKVYIWFLIIFASASFTLITASQFLITPIWLPNVLAALGAIYLRKYLKNYVYTFVLVFTLIFSASLVFDHYQSLFNKILLSTLSATQVLLFIWTYYFLSSDILKLKYRRTVSLVIPNILSALICGIAFALMPIDGLGYMMFWDYFLEQFVTGLSLICILYGWSAWKKVHFYDYLLIIFVLVFQYFIATSPLFYHCFILSFAAFYFTIRYSFRPFALILGLIGLICSIYVVLPIAGQYWTTDQIEMFSYLSSYRIAIGSMIVLFLMMAEMQSLNRQLSMHLHSLSYNDQLTGLRNRYYMHEKLLINDAEYTNTALLLIDIDDFKKVNDKYGHVFGDQVLQHISKQLKQALPYSKGTIFRWGGEEFLILLSSEQNQNIVFEVVEQIIHQIKSISLCVDNEKVNCSVSVGVLGFAILNQKNYNELLNRVDKLLYQAKENGKGWYVFESDHLS